MRPCFRGSSPRFSGDNLARNLALVERLRSIAERVAASVARVAIVSALAQGSAIIPLSLSSGRATPKLDSRISTASAAASRAEVEMTAGTIGRFRAETGAGLFCDTIS